MIDMVKYLILGFCSLLAASLSSCDTANYPPNVKAALNAAGTNRSELIKVIRNYSRKPEDSLKLKAACYLIAALPGHYYYESSRLRHYLDYSMLVKRDGWHGEYIMNSMQKLYGSYSSDPATRVYHLQTVKADSLIRNIDFSYKVWTSQPWSRHYSFDIFCEYVLPYFIDDEIPEFNKEEIYRQFSPLLDSIKSAGGSAIEAAYIVNEKLKADGWTFSMRQNHMPHLGSSRIIASRLGNCREMADLATYVMRALGLPVGNDVMPQWPQRSLGHDCNFIIDTNGKSIMFLGAEDSPGVPHFPDTKKGKIFRYTLYANTGSLEMQRDSNETIPSTLSSPFIKDVTNLYASCTDISIPLIPRQEAKHAYLSLFNNKYWVPVDWSNVENGRGNWKNVERDIVYLPVYYSESEITPAADPIEVNKDGSFHFLKPDSLHPIKKMECRMISPVVPQYVDMNSFIGGRMQGANKPDFSDAVSLYDITPRRKPGVHWNEITLYSSQKFRYLRFYGGKNWQRDCNISELAAYSPSGKLTAKVFSPKPLVANDPFGADKAVDDDLTTTFLSDGSTKYKAWVGLDFGKPVSINKIRFAVGMHRKNLDLYIVPGHTYELNVWDNGQWNTIAVQTARQSSLIFEKVPANALYLLHDSSAEVDERIFTWENNGIKWF